LKFSKHYTIKNDQVVLLILFLGVCFCVDFRLYCLYCKH